METVKADQPNQQGPGRPPLPELTLTAPKTTSWGPGQREAFVAVLADMILNAYYRKWRVERGFPERPEAACDPQPEEEAGQSPAS